MKCKRICFVICVSVLVVFLSGLCVQANDTATWNKSFDDVKDVNADITFWGSVAWQDEDVIINQITYYGHLSGTDKAQITSSNAASITVQSGYLNNILVNESIYYNHECNRKNKHTTAAYVKSKWTLFNYHGSRIMQ